MDMSLAWARPYDVRKLIILPLRSNSGMWNVSWFYGDTEAAGRLMRHNSQYCFKHMLSNRPSLLLCVSVLLLWNVALRLQQQWKFPGYRAWHFPDATQDLVFGPIRILVKSGQTIIGFMTCTSTSSEKLFFKVFLGAWTTSAVTSLWYVRRTQFYSDCTYETLKKSIHIFVTAPAWYQGILKCIIGTRWATAPPGILLPCSENFMVFLRIANHSPYIFAQS